MKIWSFLSISSLIESKVTHRERRNVDTLQFLQDALNGETLAAIPQIEESPMEKGKPFSFDVKFQSGFSNFQDLQNFVIISCRDNCQSPSGWKSGNGYNFVGNVRKDTEEFYGEYERDWRPEITNKQSDSFTVSFGNLIRPASFMVVGMKDLLHPEAVTPTYSNKVYRANIYDNNSFDLKYIIQDGKLYLRCSITSSGAADLKFDFTSTETSSGDNYIQAAAPTSDWFSTNSDQTQHSCSYPFGTLSVVKFPTLQDAYSNAVSYLAGQTMSLTIDNVPAGVANINVYYGNNGGTDILENKKENVEKKYWSLNGNQIQLNSFQVDANMKGAIIVGFKNAQGDLIGLSQPYPVKVYAQPTPRLDIKAEFYEHKCGFDLEATKQAVGSCQTVNNGQADVDFPRTKLQWKIQKTDSTIEYYPDQPEETVSLELILKLDESLRGAKAFCIDSRESEGDRETETENVKSLKIKEKTGKINLKISSNQLQCESDVFGIRTRDQDECSDIVSFSQSKHLCPAAMNTISHANCTATLINGQVLESKEYKNEDCIDTIDQVPCEDSASAPCPPKKDEIEEGGSMVWLICFIIAAALGAVLVYLNRAKSKSYSPQEQQEKDEIESFTESHVQEEK